MSQYAELPPRVYPKGRWYYLVTAEGKKRVWLRLTKIKEGLPALYMKLADLSARDVAPDRIPALVADWLKEVSGAAGRADKTRANDKWVMGAISESLAEFRAGQLEPPACALFLGQFRGKPRTFNEMRAGLRELMRFAEEKGFRPAGSNPVAAIKTMKTPPRRRYVTDSEIRRIKVAAHYGKDGKRTRMGPTIADLVDLAYLTGQRIGDLLDLRWTRRAALDKDGQEEAGYIAEEGIYFQPAKVEGSTGAKVLVQWTPKLRAAVARIEAIGRRNLRWVITNQSGQQYEYDAFKSAWARAVERSGVRGLTFHDLRAKALTDTEEQRGMQAARRMGAHSTEAQTADYVRHRKAQKTEATR